VQALGVRQRSGKSGSVAAVARKSTTGVRGLRRDARGRYVIDVRWREPGTGEWRRHQELLPKGIRAAAAKERARAVVNAALAGGYQPRKSTDPKRLRAALDAYVEHCAVVTPKTARHRKSLARVLVEGLGDARLDKLSPFAVERFRRKRRGGGRAPATINRAVKMLQHLCAFAADRDWMPRDAADAVRRVKPLREPAGRVRWLTADEEVDLLEKASPGARPIVEAAILSGMRLSELVGLRKDQVDLATRTVSLPETKSGKARHLPVGDALAGVLEVAMAASPCDHVFANGRGGAYTAQGVVCLFRRGVERAGISDLRFHDLRHHYATTLRRQGIGLDVLAKLLGHSSLQMVTRYAHLGEDSPRAAVAGVALQEKGKDAVEGFAVARGE